MTCSSEMSVLTRPTWRHIPEDGVFSISICVFLTIHHYIFEMLFIFERALIAQYND
jgi:hypothetical protein